jgi:ABC-type transport system involved in cytochrome bd biosynthesis fused ATPase/permease subunit
MQHYPTSGAPVEQQRGPAPSSVLNAVKLMYAGAAITTIAIIVSLLTIDSTRTAVRKANDHSTLTAHQITQLANFVIVAGIVSSFVAIGLWLWMAWKTGQGRGWARIVCSVLFALCTLDQLSLLKAGVAIGTIFEVVTWLVGLGAIVLLWQSSSSEYFRPRAMLR